MLQFRSYRQIVILFGDKILVMCVVTCSVLPRRACVRDLMVVVWFVCVLFFATVLCWFLSENLS